MLSRDQIMMLKLCAIKDRDVLLYTLLNVLEHEVSSDKSFEEWVILALRNYSKTLTVLRQSLLYQAMNSPVEIISLKDLDKC